MEFKVHHTAISAVHMQASIDFYRQFGFVPVLHWKQDDGAAEIAHLKLDDRFLEIFWYREHQPAPDTAAELISDLPRIGVKHLALQVASIEAAKRFVEDRELAEQVEILTGKTGVRYFFLKDPNGILVEILEDGRGL